jgi:hypothetical protein
MPAKSKSRSTAYRFSVHVKKPKSVKKSIKKSVKKVSKSLPKKSMKKMSWPACVKKARKELKLDGFVAIKKGTPLY